MQIQIWTWTWTWNGLRQIYPEKTGQNSTDTKTCLKVRAATQSDFIATDSS